MLEGYSFQKSMEIEKTEHHGEVDRISDLPDDVLLHIISLLPIESAVATCILSKRWKDVWIGIKSLDLSDYSDISSEDYPSFKIFLDKIRLSKDAHPVELIKFFISGAIDCIHASEWITSMMKRGIRKLNVCDWSTSSIIVENFSQVLSLPDSFFTSPELVELKLGDFSIRFPPSVQFSLLRYICLSDICFIDKGSIMNLLSGCPILEKLEMERCEGEGNLDLYSSYLKTLRIDHHDWSSGNISIDAPILDDLSFEVSMSHCVIRAPNVRRFHLNATNITDYCIPNMPSLVKAYLDIRGGEEKVVETLHRVRSSKSLMLGSCTILSLKDYDHGLPLFLNLTKLEVLMLSWPPVLHLLESSPRLKCLVARFQNKELEWSYPPVVPDCMHVLEEVQISGFDGETFILQMIGYILSMAKFLKRMVIAVDFSLKDGIKEIQEALERFPKVCKCEIEVY